MPRALLEARALLGLMASYEAARRCSHISVMGPHSGQQHTFFLDGHGLNILEPAEASAAGVQSAKVVNLANWSDADPKRLEAHEPEPTDVVVIVGSSH